MPVYFGAFLGRFRAKSSAIRDSGADVLWLVDMYYGWWILIEAGGYVLWLVDLLGRVGPYSAG